MLALPTPYTFIFLKNFSTVFIISLANGFELWAIKKCKTACFNALPKEKVNYVLTLRMDIESDDDA